MTFRSAVLAALCLQAGGAWAVPVHTLHAFTGGSDGANARATLILDAAGTLYGVTKAGGTGSAGTVFSLSPSGVETVLYSFSGGADGGSPSDGPLVRDAMGNLYGTTVLGGAGQAGVVFKVTPGGVETVLHNFFEGVDGGYPQGGLVADAAGNMYGVTFDGVAPNSWGSVFEIPAGGGFRTLHFFAGYPSDGARPETALAVDAAGDVYGTTVQGGASNAGVIFQIPQGGAEAVLYPFSNGADGANPVGGVTLDAAGNLYGTSAGGTSGFGQFYRVTPAGAFSTLINFTTAAGADTTYAPLARDAAGNFYGASYGGGGSQHGAVFEFSRHTAHGVVTWKARTLHSFVGGMNNATGYGALVLDGMGNLYGMSEYGGAAMDGTIYKVIH